MIKIQINKNRMTLKLYLEQDHHESSENVGGNEIVCEGGWSKCDS